MYPATAAATASPLAADLSALGHSQPPVVAKCTGVASPAEPTPAPELIEFIDFKWLMAGEGHRIDLGRLRSEAAYARGCLALAGGSTSATLRQAAGRLARSLGTDPARPQAGP
jgi:hypothetical protein